MLPCSEGTGEGTLSLLLGRDGVVDPVSSSGEAREVISPEPTDKLCGDLIEASWNECGGESMHRPSGDTLVDFEAC